MLFRSFTSACSLIMVHLSRLAEDLIIYCSTEFGFVTLSDSVSSGSSLMPQKKNPDALELLRGKAGRVFGHNMALLATLKGLPLAYNKDMQEDKEPVFDSYDTLVLCLESTRGMLDTATFNKKAMRESAEKGFITATRLADWLVMNLDLPFRDAHHVTGAIVKLADKKDLRLDQLSLKDLQSVEKRITKDIFSVLSL